jgi:hypothetical protein
MRWYRAIRGKIGCKRTLERHKTDKKLIKRSCGFDPLTSLFFKKFLSNFDFLIIHVNKAILLPASKNLPHALSLWSLAVMDNYFA